MRSSEADVVEHYMRGEAEKLIDVQPENFVAELRHLVERIFLGREHKTPPMLTMLEAPTGTSVTALSIGEVQCEWITRADSNPNRRLLYVHGGGMLAGSISTHRALASRVAMLTGCSVLTLNYRLSPENPFPAALDDCIAVSNWLSANSPTGPGESERLFMLGDSAGGGLILSALTNRRQQLNKIPDALVTLSALTDFTASSDAMQENFGKDALLSDQAIIASGLLYSGNVDPSKPEISPLHSNIQNLPPLHMQVSDSEVLLDDSRRFIEKHLMNGGEGELRIYPDMVHVWQAFAPFLPEANSALEDLAAFIKRF